MDELNELKIYRGYKATMPVTVENDDIDIDELMAVCYSPTTGEKYVATRKVDQPDGDAVVFEWPASLTSKMHAGRCNLEFYIGEEAFDIRNNFINVLKASPADGQSIVAPIEESSSSN